MIKTYILSLRPTKLFQTLMRPFILLALDHTELVHCAQRMNTLSGCGGWGRQCHSDSVLRHFGCVLHCVLPFFKIVWTFYPSLWLQSVSKVLLMVEHRERRRHSGSALRQFGCVLRCILPFFRIVWTFYPPLWLQSVSKVLPMVEHRENERLSPWRWN